MLIQSRFRRNLLLCGAAALSSTFTIADIASAAEDEDDSNGAAEVLIVGTLASRDILDGLRGISKTEIESDVIEMQQIRLVSDILRELPGIAINRTGGVGGSTQARLRGGEANHTLVFIDGIKASDPFQGEFDFATLLADDVARIEVLRGQQSALYGSDAIGGVIQYVTPSGREYPGLRVRAEGGSFGTYSGAARFGGYADSLDYVLNAAYYNTDGVVVARNGSDEIGAESFSASGKFVFAPVENFALTAVGRYSHLYADTSPQDFNFPPNPATYGYAVDGNDTTETDATYGLVKGELDLFDGAWNHTVTLQGVWADRTNDSGSAPIFMTEGTRRKFTYATSHYFRGDGTENSLTLALDNEHETFRNVPIGPPTPVNDERSLDTTGLIAEYNLNLNGHIGLGGVFRHDWHSGFENSDTYRIHGSYMFEDGLRFHSAYATGFKAPTNFELFGFDPGSFIGNPDLKPELSRGWEAGVQKEFGEMAALGASYFRNRFENEIFTVFTPSFESTVINLTDESKQQGIEFFGSIDFDNGIRIDASYTYLDAEESGAEEIRRAPHIASASITWRSIDDRFGAFFSLRYNGEQKDLNFTLSGPPHIALPPYTLATLGGDWRVSDTIQLFGRVENLFDSHYEEVYTFGSAGRAFYVGVRGTI
jgi:vitamin B12 transporter